MKLPELTKKLKLDKLSSLSKSQKILVAAVVIFLILDIAAGIVLIANKNKSAVHILGPRGEMTSLYALDSAASKGTVNNEYANFKFTKAQKEYFSKVYKDQGSVSLTVCFQMMPTKKQKELLASDAPCST